MRPDTRIETAPGALTIGSQTIHDAHPNGTLTVEQVIQKSSNVGAARIALSLPAETMWEMFADAGFGTPPKTGFPGEVGGRLRPAKSWKPIEQATMAYGHGLSVNLVQMARGYTVFASDGELKPATLFKGSGPVAGKPVLKPETARAVRRMLEMAVQPGGTAPKAQVPGYRVAGKTGTAHKLEGRGYTNKYISSFVGFAPVSKPRLVVAVMLDEPSAGQHYGGTVAAPVFSAVMGAALRMMGVPTRRAGRQRDPAAARQRNPRGNLMPAAQQLAFDVPALLARLGTVPRRITADSRDVRRGDAFAAFPGSQSDGRTFIGDALGRGAGAVFWEAAGFAWDSAWAVPEHAVAQLRDRLGAIADHVYGHPSQAMWVVGITGTNGKTSCAQWIAQGLDACGRRTGVLGTLGNGLAGALAAGVQHDDRCCAPARNAGNAQGGRGRCGGDGSVVARPGPGARQCGGFRRGAVHQPFARPPRLPRHDGGLWRGQGEAFCAGRGLLPP